MSSSKQVCSLPSSIFNKSIPDVETTQLPGLYTTLEALSQQLHNHHQLPRGTPTRTSIERFETAFKAAKAIITDHDSDPQEKQISHQTTIRITKNQLLGTISDQQGSSVPSSPLLLYSSSSSGSTCSNSPLLGSNSPSLQDDSSLSTYSGESHHDKDGDTNQQHRMIKRKKEASDKQQQRVLRQRRPPSSPILATKSYWPRRSLSNKTIMVKIPLSQDDRPIRQVQFGSHLIDTWYRAPYPEEYSQIDVLSICEYCLKYMKSDFVAKRHKEKCFMKHPPGNEIYRDGPLSIFEVDGRKNKIYCQNLCLLAKLFLDHKTLYYDVEPFLFYILTETDHHGCHFVAYFSKEKKSAFGYNLSCIMTLPPHQRKGYGQFLIDISYLLSKKEQKPGSPEKPLSNLGLLSYNKYWTRAIMDYLSTTEDQLLLETTIEDISRHTMMTMDDVIATLDRQDMLKKNEQGQFELTVKSDKMITATDVIRARQESLTWVPYCI
ncbi:acyl-CoA N-acyltransferase [Halteromyces radiatus]|uniref:acyl-CoA N-acyltransferase n=1 Tax=Halteromyces radiatus TaxID=101107 RepID=UPI00221E97D0|nr:acyl-CoA N-acyltransferase [Halteromyces radiatus]KAI8089261.1 acyl-CoA N-acyltransferase [Halteromyces radiatus]